MYYDMLFSIYDSLTSDFLSVMCAANHQSLYLQTELPDYCNSFYVLQSVWWLLKGQGISLLIVCHEYIIGVGVVQEKYQT